MGKWQNGQYNSYYILSQEGLTDQMKYENGSSPARLDEISVERYKDNSYRIVFTTHPDACVDRKQGGMHARLDYNSLFNDIRERCAGNPQLEFSSSNDENEVHYIRAWQNYLLLPFITRLEQFDNTLSEISNELKSFLTPKEPSASELEEAIKAEEARAKLLKKVLTTGRRTNVSSLRKRKRRVSVKGRAGKRQKRA